MSVCNLEEDANRLIYYLNTYLPKSAGRSCVGQMKNKLSYHCIAYIS